MENLLELTLSISLSITGYLSVGCIFKRFFHIYGITISEIFFIGAGIVCLSTLFISMFSPSLLQIASLILLYTGLIAATGTVVWTTQKGRLFNECKDESPFYSILFIMIIPLLVGTFHLRLWGDEFNMEGSMIRYWLESSNFFVDPNAEFSFYDYPRLWVLMLYHSLIIKGELHEAAGRWLSIFIVFFGAIFVWKEYYKSWNIGKWISLLCASFWMVFVFGPMFAWSASWYYSPIISVLVMISFYHIIAARRGESLDLKLVTVSAILMAMIVSIRPDGFSYLPIAVLLLFSAPLKYLRNTLKRSAIATFILLLPSAFIYFSWRYYININNLYIPGPHNSSPMVTAGRIDLLMEKFWPVTVEMFRMIITEWNLTGVLFLCLIICFVLVARLYKYLNSTEKRMLLLLTVPVYKFIYMIFANCMYLNQVRMGRHIMQTAPIVYFLLGFLIIKWVNVKFGRNQIQLSHRIKKIAISVTLVVVFILQLSLGALYAYLPSEMNNYMEYWANGIRTEYPEYKRVQLIYSRNAPPSTRIHPTWRFYATATPDIFSTLSPFIKNTSKDRGITNKWEYLEALNDEAVNAVLVYGADDEIRSIMELDFSANKSYLLEVRKKAFRIVRSEEIPYSDIWVVPWRKKAIEAFFNDIKGFFKLS